eukprot:6565264-Heterocapsa_arctica.AAC.1
MPMDAAMARRSFASSEFSRLNPQSRRARRLSWKNTPMGAVMARRPLQAPSSAACSRSCAEPAGRP